MINVPEAAIATGIAVAEFRAGGLGSGAGVRAGWAVTLGGGCTRG